MLDNDKSVKSNIKGFIGGEWGETTLKNKNLSKNKNCCIFWNLFEYMLLLLYVVT